MSIVLWVFNWFCWKKECCCFSFFNEYCNKVFTWWLSWIFLCGVLACCIVGFVTANRFGFSLYGTQCAYERIYYDIIFGQKKDFYPKWEGKKVVLDKCEQFIKIKEMFVDCKNNCFNLTNLSDIFYFSKNDIKDNEEGKKEDIDELKGNLTFPFPKEIYNKILKNDDKVDIIKSFEPYIRPIIYLYMDFHSIYKILELNKNNFPEMEKYLNEFKEAFSLDDYKSIFMKNFNYYVDVAMALGKMLPIIYFAFLLTFVVGSGALLITYFCKKRNQQWWIFPMHIAWNGLRFFIFSFFMYGCAYGMLFFGARDAIAFLKYGVFDESNIKSSDNAIISSSNSKFFRYCLLDNPAVFFSKYGKVLNEYVKYGNYLIEISNKNVCPLINEKKEYCISFLNSLELGLIEDKLKNIINTFQNEIERGLNIYDNLNCSFVNNNLNLMYRAMWDFAWETRILCALSCCIAFFGAIAVYSFLWVMYLWKREDNNYNKIYNNNYDINQKPHNQKNRKYKISPPKDFSEEYNSELVNTRKNNDNNEDD